MLPQPTPSYRAILRQLVKASISPKNVRNQPVYRNFYEIYSSQSDKTSPSFEYDMKNAMTFIQSQRMYKALLDRYNPLIDLTDEERIEATARRVGLNMPITPEDDKG